jgi:signal transduction histidine kinase
VPTSSEDLQSRLDHLGRVIPLPLLAASTLLAWLTVRTGYGTAARFEYGGILVAAAAAWTVAVTIRRGNHGPCFFAVGFVGHTALAAGLVAINPWFGIFAWTGYSLADALPRFWSRVGFVATALILAGSQIGGFPRADAAQIGIWLLVATVNAGLVFFLVDVTDRVMKQNAERGRMIEELNAANAALSVALAENAGLHVQLVEQAREAGIHDERQRLAGEIHDTLAQGLIGIVTQLEAADQARHLPAEWQRHLDQARDLARNSLTEARRSVRALRPEQLEGATLMHAIGELVSSWTQTFGVPVRVESTGGQRPLPNDVEAALFRVAQEALTNVAKHASAAKVWLTLTFLDDVVLLDVRDDGRGWALGKTGGGYGLDGMRQRLARLNGRLGIESAPGEGTALNASIPLRSAEPSK